MTKEKSLYDILKYYGMPEKNIESAITQIAQGYGACRYLEGVAMDAEATGSRYVPLCISSIERVESDGRMCPRFENDTILNASFLPSRAIKLGNTVCIFMKRI